MDTQPESLPAPTPEYRDEEFGYILLDLNKPHVAWLAYVGIIHSCDVRDIETGNVSWWAAQTLSRPNAPRFEREAFLENIRRSEFPDRLSRLLSIYSFPTLASAKRGKAELRGRELVAIAPRSKHFVAQRFDMNWIDYPGNRQEVARKYWSMEQSDEPIEEQLLSGSFAIGGTSVREQAYRTIAAASPESLALLELARLAPYFGSMVGQVFPWLKREGDDIVLSFIIRYTEQEGLQVWERTLVHAKKDKTFPVNWKDLGPLRTGNKPFALPDLRPYEVRIPLATLRNFTQAAGIRLQLRP